MSANAMREMSASEARSKFSEVFDAAYHGNPVVVRKHSRTVAIISMELLQSLAELEAKRDSEKARKALREFLKEGGTPMSQLKKELGFD
ncbi:type II toxin-antitoxin system Phd/YefM family antitoxin [Ollibium composti]|jgi:prevent-host-death family protein|uniref:Antitoxin n=1 Tax=Ollibium composti TaxID=2675109 RepID=A0ABY2Q449_9HYPH|nr:type II toxin-antitoxin system prevent-host-death family antitoxin [Mesorhizobium composti]THF55811.1 type II toxin-antitoxin system prevent-host-death family antitoxin [Mesorhizobium composti]